MNEMNFEKCLNITRKYDLDFILYVLDIDGESEYDLLIKDEFNLASNKKRLNRLNRQSSIRRRTASIYLFI